MSGRQAQPGRPAGAAQAHSGGPGASAEDYVRVRGVSKTFSRAGRTTQALTEVDLDLRRGEFLAVVGPSGCGKSTLLRLIAGLVAPSAGQIEVDGQPVREALTDIGVVFQSPVLLEWRHVLDNVLVQMELRGIDPQPHRQKALELLRSVGLGEFIDRYPRELSGGMRQRTAIVRSLIHDPPFLMMDEPFGALDALTREQMRIDLEKIWMASGKTVLFITHSIDEAALLADRVVVMSSRPGRIEREFPIDMPRPRGLSARQDPRFIATAKDITDLFLARGVLQ